jgi:hypothetical protein
MTHGVTVEEDWGLYCRLRTFLTSTIAWQLTSPRFENQLPTPRPTIPHNPRQHAQCISYGGPKCDVPPGNIVLGTRTEGWETPTGKGEPYAYGYGQSRDVNRVKLAAVSATLTELFGEASKGKPHSNSTFCCMIAGTYAFG